MTPQTLAAAVAPLVEHRRWVRLLALFQAILAVLVGLSLIGLPLAAWMGWIAVVLRQAADALDRAAEGGPDLDRHVHRAIDRLAFQFVLQAVLTVGTLVVLGGLHLAWSHAMAGLAWGGSGLSPGLHRL